METDPLAQLRDIHLPADISWWPLAPGWWILIIVFGILIVWAITKAVQRYRANLYRRQAMAALEKIENACASANLLTEVFATLKQTANIAYPNQHFSSLGINEFIQFLQRSCSSNLFVDLPDNLDSALYSSSQHQTKALGLTVLANAKIWVNKHRREAPQSC